ncbi:MAG: zinc ribbon domain-containing protein [Spirochaetota bacterium]|nr:zinc ribbon domain-containing protein [Spirochaetota bacterium]
MPIYEFECGECGEKFEKLVSNHESGRSVCCPKCDASNPRKLLSLFSSNTNPGTVCDSSGST